MCDVFVLILLVFVWFACGLRFSLLIAIHPLRHAEPTNCLVASMLLL